VLTKVHEVLDGIGIQVKHGLRLVGLDSDDSKLLTAAIFEESTAVGSSSAVSAWPCNVLLCCGRKSVERATFEAINSNSLVYDGRLVVDHNFRTNDQVVYAAGVITKFARKYRCQTSTELCSSREAGTRLAQCLLPVLDPLSGAFLEAGSAPNFEKPFAQAATLPGGLYYLHISSPKPARESFSSLMSHPKLGRELVSEPATGSHEYLICAVRLDTQGIIHSIVYLGSQPVEEQNWMCLIGLPETALNNLASRFDENIISDLPSFLRQNWAIALYHDRFSEFRLAIREELEKDEDFVSALSRACSNLENSQEQMDVSVFLSALPPGKHGIVRTRLRDFIHTNKNQLEMYQPF